MKAYRAALIAVIVACVAAVSAVSFHSVEEIHYLKTFYPKSFTVEEALYASLVELVKVLLVSLPLVLVIAVSLYLLKYLKERP